MKTYTITKETYLKITTEADNDSEIKSLYRQGVVDELLSCKNQHEHYLITDEDDNVIFEHTYT